MASLPLSEQNTTRRRFLKGLETTAVGAGIVGCGRDNTDPNTSTTPPSTTSTSPSTTDTGEIQAEIQNPELEIAWTRDLDQVQQLPSEHTAGATVTTSDGVSPR